MLDISTRRASASFGVGVLSASESVSGGVSVVMIGVIVCVVLSCWSVPLVDRFSVSQKGFFTTSFVLGALAMSKHAANKMRNASSVIGLVYFEKR